MARIVYSLNWQTIPEFFEDHLTQWMDLFHAFLTLPAPPLQASSSDEPQPVERLQTAILDVCMIYAEKYAEEFEPHLARCVAAGLRVVCEGPGRAC
jgi:exportin-2 (importin alpha re-exporter)